MKSPSPYRQEPFLDALEFADRAEQTVRQPGVELCREVGVFGQHAPHQLARDLDHAGRLLRRRRHAALGFHEQRQRRLPRVQEAFDETREVVRHELMDDIVAETARGDLRRGDRARGQKHTEAEIAQTLDQRARRQHLADAGAMNPYQLALRPRDAGIAVTLSVALCCFKKNLTPNHLFTNL